MVVKQKNWPCSRFTIPFASIVDCLGALDHTSRRNTASSAGNRWPQGQSTGCYSSKRGSSTPSLLPGTYQGRRWSDCSLARRLSHKAISEKPLHARGSTRQGCHARRRRDGLAPSDGGDGRFGAHPQKRSSELAGGLCDSLHGKTAAPFVEVCAGRRDARVFAEELARPHAATERYRDRALPRDSRYGTRRPADHGSERRRRAFRRARRAARG